MEPQHKPVGAPERLDVPFELKAIETLTGDEGVEVGVFEGLAFTFGNRNMVGDVVEPGAQGPLSAGPLAQGRRGRGPVIPVRKSACGYKQTSSRPNLRSALPPATDILDRAGNVSS